MLLFHSQATMGNTEFLMFIKLIHSIDRSVLLLP